MIAYLKRGFIRILANLKQQTHENPCPPFGTISFQP